MKMRWLMMILFFIIQHPQFSLFTQAPYTIDFSPQNIQSLGKILIIGLVPLLPTLPHRRFCSPLIWARLLYLRALLCCFELEQHFLQFLAFFLSPSANDIGQVNGTYLQSAA